jgi:hypothetical protein
MGNALHLLKRPQFLHRGLLGWLGGIADEGMIFSEKGRGAPFLRKNHPWILQPRLG